MRAAKLSWRRNPGGSAAPSLPPPWCCQPTPHGSALLVAARGWQEHRRRPPYTGFHSRARVAPASSSLAMVSKWTMSGPSARRRVRAPANMCARGVTSLTPAAPCTCDAPGGGRAEAGGRAGQGAHAGRPGPSAQRRHTLKCLQRRRHSVSSRAIGAPTAGWAGSMRIGWPALPWCWRCCLARLAHRTPHLDGPVQDGQYCRGGERLGGGNLAARRLVAHLVQGMRRLQHHQPAGRGGSGPRGQV